MGIDQQVGATHCTDDRSPIVAPLPNGLKSVVLVGQGNIGSVTAVLLARSPQVGRITLVDKDKFEAKNVWGQDVDRREIGQWKAQAVARRLRRIRPDLEVKAIVGDVEDVPAGLMCADVIAGCLDSRGARRHVAALAWNLSVNYVDAGVEPMGLLARVNVYPSTGDGPCYQCGWSKADYEAVEQVYACSDGSPDVPPTDAPACLGSLAASLQVIEVQKLLGGSVGEVLTGCELLVDAASGKQFVTRLWREPACAFEHRRWDVAPVSRSMSVRKLLEQSRARLGNSGAEDLALRVPGRSFARKMTCGQCGRLRDAWRIVSLAGLRTGNYRCSRCRGAMVAAGQDMTDALGSAELSRVVRRTRLASLGLRSGDVLGVVSGDREVHFEVAPMKRSPAAGEGTVAGTWTTAETNGGRERGQLDG